MAQVNKILISPLPHQAMESKSTIEVIEGQGIVGDRYFYPDKKYSEAKFKRAPREITLVEKEALEQASAECNQAIEAEMLRRNVVTEGADLGNLEGKQFKVGDVILEGLELCQPCQHISDMNKMPLIKIMLNRAGLRSKIIKGGKINVNDPILPL